MVSENDSKQINRIYTFLPNLRCRSSEVAVDAFHEGRIGFVDIVDAVARVVDAHTGRESDASTVEGVLDADAWAREQAAAGLGL